MVTGEESALMFGLGAIRVGLPFKRLLQRIMLNWCRLVELPGGEQ